MRELELITLRNSNGAVLEILNFGATIAGLKIPDKHNKSVNVVLGLNEPKDYIDINFQRMGLFLGSTVGRYAGRISKGGFSISGQYYTLHSKDGIHLHGGREGFDKKFWTIEYVEKGPSPFVVLSYESMHLEEGYPGNLKVKVKYQLTENNTFIIRYSASTDRATHINLTNHSYFNLNGMGSILGQQMYINSERYLETDRQLIPTGNFKDVSDTRFDFTETSLIPSNFLGFDDIFVLNDNNVKASLYAESTGILMRIKSNQPAMVVYTPKTLQDMKFRDNMVYDQYPAICFETQNFPDTPNNLHFPSSLLLPNSTYNNSTSYEFYIE